MLLPKTSPAHDAVRPAPAWHLLAVACGALLVAAVSGYRHWDAVQRVSFFGDENDWAARAYFYRLAFLDRDVRHKLWGDLDGIDHPHVTDFLIGAGLQAFDTVPSVPERSRSWVAQSPPFGDKLLAARAPCALLGSAVAVLVYLIGLLASGRPLVGLVAGATYASAPLASEWQVRAMSEAPLLFFTCLGMLLVVWAWPAGDRAGRPGGAFSPRRRAFLLLGPLALALAVGSKLTGLVPVLAFAASLVVLIGWQLARRRAGSAANGKAWAAWGALALALTALLAVAVNPTLYPAPLARFRAMLEHRWLTAQGQRLGWPDDVLDGYLQQVHALFHRLVWEAGSFRHPLLNLAQFNLAVLGFGALCVREGRRALGPAGPSRALPLLAWALVLLTVLTPSMPLNWARYHLPYLPCWALLSGFGTLFVIDWVARRFAPAPSAVGPPCPDEGSCRRSPGEWPRSSRARDPVPS